MRPSVCASTWSEPRGWKREVGPHLLFVTARTARAAQNPAHAAATPGPGQKSQSRRLFQYPHAPIPPEAAPDVQIEQPRKEFFKHLLPAPHQRVDVICLRHAFTDVCVQRIGVALDDRDAVEMLSEHARREQSARLPPSTTA